MRNHQDKTVTPQIVKHIASLARINLTDEQTQRLATDLAQILEYITKLEKLDVKGIEPTSHVLELHNVIRKDSVKPSLTQAEALSTAGSKEKGAFTVPQVIE